MRQVEVCVSQKVAGILTQEGTGSRFIYLADYQSPPISLTMTVSQ